MNKTIDLTINKEGLAHNIQKAKENNIIIPTIAQMQNPDLIPEKIKEKLSHTGLWDVDPVNLFRINWHNEAKESGGLYQKTPNYVEIPSSVSGVPCRILAMSGKWFPTGCHKVGASFGCLAPRLVTGQFDATYHHAVWPSTGNYCRGGAFNSKLSPATPSPFCRRICPRSASTGSRPSPARSSQPRAASPTSRKSSTRPGSSSRILP